MNGQQREHPVFRQIRALTIFHRTVLVLVALAGGRCLAYATRRLPRTEGLLILLALAVLGLVLAGLYGFTHLRPWCVPVLMAAFAACALPVSRQVDAVIHARVAGQDLSAERRLLTLDAPGLFLSLRFFLEFVAVALVVWLAVLRGTHRRLAEEQPLAAAELRPRRLAIGICAALVAVELVVARPPAGVPSESAIGEAGAVTAVHAAAAGDGNALACARPSAYLAADLVTPFYLVVFVVESAQPDVAGLGVAHVHAGSGAVHVWDLTPVKAAPARLCEGLTFDASVRTRTRLPLTSPR